MQKATAAAGSDMPKAVIYTRYSPGGRQTDQSTEGQLRDCYEYCEREGYMVVGEYNDRHVTGRYDDRPAFQTMVADSAKHIFDYVVVWKLDRFARNRYDSADYKHKLKKNGVRVLSAKETISENPEGIILEGMLESMAEYYSANLSQNVRRGLRESAIKGTFTGGLAPLGYKVVDKKIFIDEEKAPIIRFAFEQYSKGVPKREIVQQLNAKGITNSKGKPLTLTSFQYALKNQKYIGITIYNGIEYQNTYPALIERSVFNKVQERLAKVAHAPAAGKARQEYLLQGKAYCGLCGTKMVGDAGTSKTGEMHYYYACGARKKSAQTCRKKSEKKDFLEWYVVEQTVEYVLTPARMEYIAKRVVEEYDKEFNNSNVKELERKIAKLEHDADKTFKLIMESESSSIIKRYEKQIELFELQKNDLEIDLSKMQIANGIRYTKADVLAWLKQFTKGDLFDETFRRRIIDVFVNSIYLYDDKVVIYYNIKDGKQVSYIDNCDALDSASTDSASTDSEGASGASSVRISNGTLRHCIIIRTFSPIGERARIIVLFMRNMEAAASGALLF